jgi:alpha-glucosidase (family GH31 glycosyl hydrolase)
MIRITTRTICNVTFALISFLFSQLSRAQHLDSVRLTIQVPNGEFWWVGIINHGDMMPLTQGYHANLHANLYGNQAQPLLLSSHGNVVWSDNPFSIKFDNYKIELTKASGKFISKKTGNSLREAYLYASANFFPPSGTMPDTALFSNPQYNTWIELLYDQNQNDVLKYAKAIIDNGFPPGVIMIDDNWQEDYGTWKFHPRKFSNPSAMIDTLHQWGFKVMLWVCPFVSPDSETFRKLQAGDLLLKDNDGYPKMVKWWNGSSALLDFTDTGAVKWFNGELQHLIRSYKVDGFKFDAGDPEYYVDVYADRSIDPNEHAQLFAKIGLSYPLNEYRATWKMGGQPLAQRLRDKGHSWNDLQLLIPNTLLQGIMGYPFTCPDMIGGGEMGSFVNLKDINQDLIVRSAQCHALMPMMQFSVAPWRILDKSHLDAVKEAIVIRSKYIGLIKDLVSKAAVTGEPAVRMMCYEFPHEGFEKINDQFMLGDKVLVAPVVNAGNTRKVVLPKGKWLDVARGKTISGPRVIQVSAPLNELPVFIKK